MKMQINENYKKNIHMNANHFGMMTLIGYDVVLGIATNH